MLGKMFHQFYMGEFLGPTGKNLKKQPTQKKTRGQGVPVSLHWHAHI